MFDIWGLLVVEMNVVWKQQIELVYIKDVLYISWVIDKSTTWRNDDCDFYLSSNRLLLGKFSIEWSAPVLNKKVK